jgi:hypothetical protein
VVAAAVGVAAVSTLAYVLGAIVELARTALRGRAPKSETHYHPGRPMPFWSREACPVCCGRLGSWPTYTTRQEG